MVNTWTGPTGAMQMPAPSILSGVATIYGSALATAGGREIHVLSSHDNRPSVHAAIYDSPPYAISVPPLAVPRLAVNLTSACVHGGISGDKPRSFSARRHSMFLTPAGASVNWRKESPSRHLMIYFQPDEFAGVDADARLAGVTPAIFNTAVPGCGRLIDQIDDELQGAGILYAEAADSLARLLLIRLMRHLHGASDRPEALTPKTVARLRDYIMENLGARILVADLARQAGLSPNRFALSFTRSTGQTPHQFVLASRVERALLLLTQSRKSLATIAYECGFATQQHMSNVIVRRIGMTPSRYRALCRGGAGE